jgi:hypothetical protein
MRKLGISTGATAAEFGDLALEGGDVTWIVHNDMSAENGDFVLSRAYSSTPEGEMDTVRFLWVLYPGEGPSEGRVFTEAGMFYVGANEQDRLFSRVVFAPMHKTQSRTLGFKWIITFS